MVAVLLLVLTVFDRPRAQAVGPTEDDGVTARRVALRLLHDGRFDEADEVLARAAAVRPEDPAVAFFRAFVVYWRLLYDDENPLLLQRFEQRLTHAAGLAAAALERSGREPKASLWAGSSRLLLAQLRASQKKPLAAAREAREAKRLLEDAAAADPTSPDVCFGLGTYNYYADRVPTLVKGLRFLLRLPGGDRKKGLQQLDRAARERSYFALEARVVLATIYSSRHERRYVEALREAEKALVLEPSALAALDGAARLDLSLGRYRAAARRLDDALERAQASPRIDATVLARLRYERARVEFSRFRPDRTLERLRPLLAAQSSLPKRLRQEVVQLAASAENLISPHAIRPVASGTAASARADGNAHPSSWEKILPALELERGASIEASADALLRLAKESPAEPVVWLLAGRALVLAGRGREALPWLERAEASKRLPDAWLGPCRLLAGQAADLSGLRAKALEFYRRAAKSQPFIESNAAHLYQVRAYPIPELG